MKVYEFFGAHDEGVQKVFGIDCVSLYEFAAKDWAALNSLGAYKAAKEVKTSEPSNAPALFDVAPITPDVLPRLGDVAGYGKLLRTRDAIELDKNTVSELKQLLVFIVRFGSLKGDDVFAWLYEQLKDKLSREAYYMLNDAFKTLGSMWDKGHASTLIRVIRDAESVFNEGRNTWKDWIAEEHWQIDYLFEVDNIEENLAYHGCGFWEDELRLSDILEGAAMIQKSLRAFFNIFGNESMPEIPVKEYMAKVNDEIAEKEELEERKWSLRRQLRGLLEGIDTKEGLQEIEAAIAKLEK